MPTRSQKLAVAMAFVAAALSLTAVAVRFFRHGEVDVTPLFGGIFMLTLGVGGYLQLQKPAAPRERRKGQRCD